MRGAGPDLAQGVFLYRNDLELGLARLFCSHEACFQIELVFRDAKQSSGLNDC